MNQEFIAGKFETIQEVSAVLTNIINRNGGGKAPLQQLNILNDFIVYIHQAKSHALDEMRVYEENDVKVEPEEDIESFINHLLRLAKFPVYVEKLTNKGAK